MPSLQNTLRGSSPEGFTPAPPRLPLPSPIRLQDNSFKVNLTIRCPLPPINATVDTLRQFNDGDYGVPHRRVLPLPVNTEVGGGTIVNNTTVVSSSGSGSASGATSLTAKVIAYTSSLLTPGSSSFNTLGMSSKSFQLISCTANTACEIRLYGTSVAMAIDASRPMDAPLPAELANNIITDVVLDTAPYTWNWQNRVGANSNSPQTTNLYIAVTNIGDSAAQPQITFTFLPLESL